MKLIKSNTLYDGIAERKNLFIGFENDEITFVGVIKCHPMLIHRGMYSKVNLKMLLVVLRSPCCRDDLFNPI